MQNEKLGIAHDKKMSQIIRKESESTAKRENKFKELMGYDQNAIF